MNFFTENSLCQSVFMILKKSGALAEDLQDLVMHAGKPEGTLFHFHT